MPHFTAIPPYCRPLPVNEYAMEAAVEALGLADEYLLPRLKQLLQQQLLPTVSDATCVSLLAAADLYSAKPLREACVEHLLLVRFAFTPSVCGLRSLLQCASPYATPFLRFVLMCSNHAFLSTICCVPVLRAAFRSYYDRVPFHRDTGISFAPPPPPVLLHGSCLSYVCTFSSITSSPDTLCNSRRTIPIS